MIRNRTFQIGAAIFVVSLVLRLIVLIEVKDHPTVAACKVLDIRGNHEFALAILEGLRPTTYYKAPFYSYFLAGIYAVAGPDPFCARVVQIVLTSFTPVLIFLIGQHFFGRGVGQIAGWASSGYWTFLYYSMELLDTGLACLMYMLLAYLLVVMDDRKWPKWFVCGLLLGLGAITRPNILAFAPVLAIVVLIVGWRRAKRSDEPSGVGAWRRLRSPVAHVVALTIGCCLAISPVTIRNRVVGGEWVLLGAYGGMNLYVANNPHSDSKNGPLLVDESRFIEPSSYDPNEPWARCCLNYYSAHRTAEAILGRPPKPGEFASVLAGMARDFLVENPRWLARHAVRRLVWLFNTFEFPSNRNLYHFRQWSHVLTAASVLQFGVICPLALLGLGMALSRRELRTPPMAYVVSMLASLMFPTILFIVNMRFRVPMVHLLMPFAAYGAVQVIGLFRSGVTWRRRALIGGAVLGLAVFSNVDWFDYSDTTGIHLEWAMISACEQTGRDDLLPQAAADFERALARHGDDTTPSDATLVLKHAHPMAWLFRYHNRRGDLAAALGYADRMLARERYRPSEAKEAFDLFLRVGDRESAKAVTEAVGKRFGMALQADCLLAFGRTFHDRAALIRAHKAYERVVRQNPSELRYHRAMDEARQLLERTATRATSAPTTTRTGPS